MELQLAVEVVHNVVVNCPESREGHSFDCNKSTALCRRCSHTLKIDLRLIGRPWPPHNASLDTAIKEDTFERRHNSRWVLVSDRCSNHWNAIQSRESSHPDRSPTSPTTMSLRLMEMCVELSLCLAIFLALFHF